MFSRAGTCWRRSRLPGAGQPRWTDSPAGVATRSSCATRATLVRSGGLPELDQIPLGAELMPLGITVEAAPWTATAHFPPRRVVPTRGAPHHHPRALEVEHGVMAAEPAQRLAQSAGYPRHHALELRRGGRFGGGCKLFGVIGHHGTHLLTSSWLDAGAQSGVSNRPPHGLDINRYATSR